VTRFVIDASVALKWVVSEPGSADAASLRWAGSLLAPDLIVAEVGNALWKAVRRGELSPDEAVLAAELLERAAIELRPMRNLLAVATRLAISLDHPVYDCVYMALARAEACPLVTADERLIRQVAASDLAGVEVLTPGDVAQRLARPGRG
jgi:predicted nucleic acid-binding protein